MIIRILTCLAYLIFFVTCKSKAQDTLFVFPSAKEINVTVFGKVTQKGNRLLFSYQVKSNSTSRQNVFEFYVEYSSETFEIAAPPGWAGLPSSTKKRVVMWGSRDSTSDILPGNDLNGFAFESDGLPSFVTSYVRGAFKEPSFPEGQAPDSILGSDIFENSVKIIAIGPVVPPGNLIPIVFLDTLISYKHQAFALGWIKNQGIVTSLDAKLDNAKRQLERNNKTAAKNILRAFVNEVEALNKGGGQITSEAYALLRFNAEYLISKL